MELDAGFRGGTELRESHNDSGRDPRRWDQLDQRPSEIRQPRERNKYLLEGGNFGDGDGHGRELRRRCFCRPRNVLVGCFQYTQNIIICVSAFVFCLHNEN